MTTSRLQAQVAFLVEADRLKLIARRTTLADGSRFENSAEHSWHLALAAMILAEYVPANVDVLRVLQLVTVHDLVEIDAGDTFAYDASGQETREARERAAAERIFGLLPADQRQELRQLWDEFEAHATPESRFANALDRLQALLLNSHAGGGSWAAHSLTRHQVLTRMAPVETALPEIWPYMTGIVDAFCACGVIALG